MKVFYIIAMMVVISIIINTRLVVNLWTLLTDSSNYIPDHSSLFSFKPTKVDEGSGGYWRYGEDYHSYYYFLEKDKDIYIYSSKDKACKNIDKLNHLTWCNKKVVHH